MKKNSKYLLLLISIASITYIIYNKFLYNTPNSKSANFIEYQFNKHLLIDAKLDIKLTSAMNQALHSGIHLNFISMVILQKNYQFLGVDWQDTQKTISYETQLSYNLFDKNYYIYNHRNKKFKSFKSQQEALSALGNLYQFAVIEIARMHPAIIYNLSVDMQFDSSKLPAPLWLATAFDINNDWKLSVAKLNKIVTTQLVWQ